MNNNFFIGIELVKEFDIGLFSDEYYDKYYKSGSTLFLLSFGSDI